MSEKKLNQKPPPDNRGQDPASGLLIIFAGEGSAEFTIKPLGSVSANQIAAVGANLVSRADLIIKMTIQEARVEQQIAAEEARRRGQIAVPGLRMPEGSLKAS